MVRIDGHDLATLSQREGFLWEDLSGRRPRPPIGQLLGWSLQMIDPEEGTVELAFPANPAFTNHAGVIQGGILAAMLDTTMGLSLAGMLDPNESPATVELKINFLRPAMNGPLVGAGRVVRKGSMLAFLESRLQTDAGDLVATASATFQIRTRR